jgi:hypothetical protein
LASLALATGAFAGSDKYSQEKTQSSSTIKEDSSATGGSGAAGATGSSEGTTAEPQGTTMHESSAGADKSGMASGNELTGKVVRSDKKTLYVEHMGAVVPLKIDRKTKFEGDTLKSSRDLKEGQEIRASFTVENGTNNVATSIGLSSEAGRGGSGFSTDVNSGSPGDVTSPAIPPADMGNNGTLPEPERSPSTPLPEEPGTQQNNPTY